MPFNKIALDGETNAQYQNITSIYNALDSALSQLEDSREKFLTITNLEQSHMWLVKTLERSQLERNFRSGNSIPQQPVQQPATPSPSPKQETKLSPDASVLAESRQKLDSLLSDIKDLTDTVAVKGFPIGKG
jgi:hypothetical protein